jgi:Zn-dependent alcohol dehydrogenase
MRAAVCRQGSDLFCIEELSIEDPRADEVLVRFTATGL